ncbi:alpha/beta fold hydrolase [Algiphilus sp.]|uniref:alpha/beta fold hydrolase n=1 Tax=Algiphilus sp. TaxID=1872431 RepID=UPI003B51825B
MSDAPVALHCPEAGNGPSVLLIHGLGASHQDWRDVAPRLAKSYQVFTPDLRGYGNSPRGPGPYRPDIMAQDVLALMESQDIRQAHVVGHSMGGAVAVELALCVPERVRSLTIANSVPAFRPTRLREWFEIGLRLATMSVLGPRRLGQIMGRRMFPKPEQAELRRFIEARAAANQRWVYLSSLLALTQWSAVERLHELVMPVAILASGNDYFPVEDMRRYAESVPDGHFYCFPDARHGVPLEAGAEMARCLQSFFEGSDQGGPRHV